MVVATSEAIVKTVTLPDGSVVILNENTSISYPNKFAENVCQVTISGEAFFNISPDKTKHFIIEAKDIEVKVVGASFNVKTKKMEQK